MIMGILSEVLHSREVSILTVDASDSIRDMCTIKWPAGRLNSENICCCRNGMPRLSPGSTDMLLYEGSKNFSSSKVWHTLRAEGRLLTKDRLNKWNVISDNNNCVFCGACETMEHLFFSCPFSVVMWRKLTVFINHFHVLMGWSSELQRIVEHNLGNGSEAAQKLAKHGSLQLKQEGTKSYLKIKATDLTTASNYIKFDKTDIRQKRYKFAVDIDEKRWRRNNKVLEN
ncbi:hypothetical protein LIER_22372 [Lithospermum erythrorhizon]|uniref:Reverse transcriptase zinc-binding domain-containing protein n=1 Tax=Lithospermum erythrorhizon TaxID=34254 RepID=A0AAV3QWS6_LITER